MVQRTTWRQLWPHSLGRYWRGGDGTADHMEAPYLNWGGGMVRRLWFHSLGLYWRGGVVRSVGGMVGVGGRAVHP